MSPSTWVAIIVPLLGFLGTVATVLASRRQDKATATKTSAEALHVVQETTLNLLDPLQQQIDQLRAENTYLQGDVKELRARVDIVEDDRDVLADAVGVQVQWEDSGRLDPPGAPSIPAKVRLVLNRLHTTA